jgi:hypothetical protein
VSCPATDPKISGDLMEKDGNSQLKYLTTKIEPKKTREIHR